MKNNINYEKKLEFELDFLKNSQKKPKLLLHVCCGPCFTIPYEIIKEYFDLTLFFNNSNIYPKNEHDRRLDELKKYMSEVCPNVPLITTEYNNDLYNIDLEPRANDKEGHERCRICFKKRLSEGFEYASKHGFDYYGTVMTISRYKNAQDINQIGEELQKKYPTIKWLYADFKKNNGYEKSLLIIKEHKMYLQEYCGCKYSFEAYKNKPKNAKIDL
ncbi:MAG: epoxyqueuosine reductase QueH [Bacilli bacterium]|nr:epoxyqueuosine reductase QueH [Bacilli bacterium]